jgi:hypothetical protein
MILKKMKMMRIKGDVDGKRPRFLLMGLPE